VLAYGARCPCVSDASPLPCQQANNLEKAKLAYDKASTAQERMGSPWHAAKHLETCGDLAKQLEQWEEVALYFKRASQLYLEGGKGPTGTRCCGLPRACSAGVQRVLSPGAELQVLMLWGGEPRCWNKRTRQQR
jgi:hypothetical protein